MKKMQMIFFISVVSGVFNFCLPEAGGPVKIWETKAVLQVPESVMYDKANAVLYVSNINGKPLEKNGKGYISQIDVDGKILKLKWMTGFNAPKGMGIFNSMLFVSDIDRIHQIDIEKRRIVVTVTARGAHFLNDIAIGNMGTVYISDMKTSKIYRFKDRKIEEWTALEYPGANGMLMTPERLLVGTAGGIVALDLKTRKPELLVPHENKIDGLKLFEEGTYIISDWSGKTELIGKKKKLLLDTTGKKIQAADFEYLHDKRILLIPTFFHNRVMAYRIP